MIPNFGFNGHESCKLHGFRPHTPALPPVRVFDCFLFHSELDLLEIRLNELHGVVDAFVLIEGTRTFTDKEKPLYFSQAKDQPRFAQFLPKIKHAVMREKEFKRLRSSSAFKREGEHRRFIMRALIRHEINLRAGDLLIISDADELVRQSTVQLARNCIGLPPVLMLQTRRYKYSFAFSDGSFDTHSSIRLYFGSESEYGDGGNLTEMQMLQAGLIASDAPASMRSRRHLSARLFVHQHTANPEGKPWHGKVVALGDAGWHCSFCFQYLQEFVEKIGAYSHHARARRARHKQLHHIQQVVCHGQDLFDMWPEAHSYRELIAKSGPLEPLTTTHTLPAYLVRHPARFSYLLPGKNSDGSVPKKAVLEKLYPLLSSLPLSSPLLSSLLLFCFLGEDNCIRAAAPPP